MSTALPASNEDYDSFKQLILAVLNGMKRRQYWPSALVDLAEECALIRNAVARKHPDLIAKLRKTARNPAVTLLSLSMMDLEQREVDAMIKAAGASLMSVEHDGVVLRDASADIVAAVRAATKWPTHVDGYPQSRAEFLEFAAARCPGYEWTQRSRFEWASVLEARASCDAMLFGGDEDDDKIPFSNRHTDFALVVASRLEGDVVLDKSRLCIFDEKACAWNMDGTDAELQSLVRELLHDEFRVKCLVLEDHIPKWKATGTVAGVLKSHSNINVKAEVRSMLCGRAPALGDPRLMLPFQNGMVFDFEGGRVLRVHRGIAPSRWVPHAYTSWQIGGDIQREFYAVIADMIEWEKTEGGDLLSEPPTGDVEKDLRLHKGNPELAGRFVEVLRKIPGAAFVTHWFDADGVAYLMKHYVRMMSAAPKFCEMLNIHGPPRSGKDALAALFEKFMGNIDEGGFAGGLMPEHVHVKRSKALSSADGPTPFTHALRGCRSVIVPELRQEAVDMELLKGIIEQEGALITSRECRGNVNRWQPSALLVTFGNYCPDFGEVPVDGTARRVNVLAMQTRFAVEADHDLNVLKGDFSLKQRIAKGEVFNDFFHVAAAFYPFLKLYGDKIRQPRKVVLDTQEALASDTADRDGDTEPWYLKIFQATDQTHPALTQADVRRLTKEKLGLRRLSDATTALVKEGFQMDKIYAKLRGVMFKFPGSPKPVFVAARA